MSKSPLLKKETMRQPDKSEKNLDNAVALHYTRPEMGQAILKAVEKTASDPRNLTLADLAPYDEMHIGGRPASTHLIDQLHLTPGMEVLDIGSGLGGVARYAATEYEIKVRGIDLTPEHKAIATLLSEKVGLIDEVRFDTGSALDMPFEDNHFDAAYTVHTAMNIQNKRTFYNEISRVLKPKALFGLYDVMAGTNSENLSYPMPWADSVETSFLESPTEIQAFLSDAGFNILRIEGRRDFAIKMLKKVVLENKGILPDMTPPPIRSADWGQRMENLLHAIEQDHCAPWQIICEKVTH